MMQLENKLTPSMSGYLPVPDLCSHPYKAWDVRQSLGSCNETKHFEVARRPGRFL